MSTMEPTSPGDRDRPARRALGRLDREPRRGGRQLRQRRRRRPRHPSRRHRAPRRSDRGPRERRGHRGRPRRAPPALIPPPRPAASPQAALAAYQRAEAVINKADAGCRLPWELVAAIGRVESDHGRFGGNTLDDEGVARPGIYGIALNGKNNTQDISDTDAGAYDNDTRHDRAVGPMQFIPSTWSVVGVDGDSDGKRNPQDIDDAALASAVYLCSGDDDLSQEAGQRVSVYRYNHSNDYVDLVLSIMQAYMDGDFSAVPTSTLTAGVILPDLSGPGGGGSQQQGDQDGNGGKGGTGARVDRTATRTTTRRP